MADEYECQENCNVDSLDGDASNLVSAMKKANDARLFPDQGRIWWIHSKEGCLIAGVRGDRGVLTWMDGSGCQLRPSEADNLYFADYYTWECRRHRQAPRREVGIERVFDAVCELVDTRVRPTCVDWVADVDARYEKSDDGSTLALAGLTLLGALPDRMRNFSTWPPRMDTTTGRLWVVLRDFEADSPVLFAGVRGELGYLAWRDETGRLSVPADGQDRGGRYLTHGGFVLSEQKGSEVPVDVVINAVVDFIGWRRQPQSVVWRPAASPVPPR